MTRFSPPALALLAVALGRAAEPAAPPAPTADQLAAYEKDVLPLLKANCLKCHGGDKTKGGLDLTNREAVFRGGDTRPAVDLARPADSLLLKAVNYADGLEMPPSGKLSADKIETLTKWVKAGAPMPAGKAAAVKPPEPKHDGGKVTEEAKRYWAYQPVKRPAAPAVKDAAWVKNPIDAFVLAKLEGKGLRPAGPADKVALVRRASYDLTGLPPTPEQIDAFVNDPAADAYERLIDALLASPHYGEKWGRHWLDVVRFAETNGYERDGPKPFAWKYRDYVIRSFNADKPFDRFVKEQLAGDEIDRDDPDCVVATGYYRLGLWDDEPADPLQARFDDLDDVVATTSQAFLGMTMNCARCHDHKIDPIPQADYYRLVAFVADVPRYSDTRDVRSPNNLTDVTPREKRVTYEAELAERQAKVAELVKKLTAAEDEVIKRMPAEDQRASEGPDRPTVIRERLPKFITPEEKKEYGRLKRELDALKNRPLPSQEFALSVNNCSRQPAQTHVLVRGNPHAPGAAVEPGFPSVLGVAAPKLPPAGPRSSGRRSVLADWVAAKDNPLTARVTANRVWQWHFGRGIVPTPNDFGKFGEKPTHPELLDWLAAEFVEGGWTLKRMHRLIMTSNAYRMSARADAAGLKADPENKLFWRFNPRRLAAEEVRDSVLAVSGKLSLTAGGPSVYPPIPREVLAGQSVPGQGWGKSSPEEASRRSVYVHVKRSLLVPILSQHDQADTDTSCPVRYTTTVPTQSLGMLNGPFTNEQAGFLAERAAREAPGGLEAQVRRVIRLTTGREPGEKEVAGDVAYVRAAAERDRVGEREALRLYCLLALNANEFVYLD